MTARASIEPLGCQRLRQLIERAVRANAPSDVLGLLRSSESLPEFGRVESLGLQVLGQGFGGGMSSSDRTSFAAYCMKYMREGVLETVLRSDLASVRDLVTKVTGWQSMVVSKRSAKQPAAGRAMAAHSQPMLDSAFRLTSSRGMRLAIEFEGHTKRLHEPARTNPMADARTCHADALDFAVAYVRNAGFEESLEVCRVFVEHRLPATSADSVDFVLETLAGIGGWGINRESMRTLFELYADAGYLMDLDRPLGPNHAHRRALSVAIDTNNREVALGLLRLGADPGLVGEDLGAPGADILDIISTNAAGSAEFVAEVASFLMERQLAGREQRPASSGAAPRRRTVRL